MGRWRETVIAREHITGIVLAGGRGSRMGGVDKGLQNHLGIPLTLHAMQRLQAQVGALMISANRHLDTYASFGVPVWPDAVTGHPGHRSDGQLRPSGGADLAHHLQCTRARHRVIHAVIEHAGAVVMRD